MSTTTLILIIFAAITALFLALFQYVYKSKLSKGLRTVLTICRMVSWFLVFLLLINPQFTKETFTNIKPKLVVAIDNSESIAYLNQKNKVDSITNLITNHAELNTRFDIDYFTFGAQLQTKDSLSFSKKQTNISQAIKQLNTIYNTAVAPIILLSDGNQTYGNDYRYTTSKQPIFPVVLGDTTQYVDLKIKQINSNRYAYLKNKFPVEIIVNYNGKIPVKSQLVIQSGNATVFKTPIQLNTTKTSKTINALITASSVGVNTYKAFVNPINSEKNTTNNSQNFAVEVIDQTTNVAIVSNMPHPDIGALKKAIETNAQRKVFIVTPKAYIKKPNSYQLAVLYQPKANFLDVFNTITANALNSFIIAGTATDYNFLNTLNLGFSQKTTTQTEAYQAELNPNFNTFIINNLDFSSLPPLKSEFGATTLTSNVTPVLYKTVNGISTQNPMLAFYERSTVKQAVLFGEDFWRWRAQVYLQNTNFEAFDNFVNKIVQYLSSSTQRKRLNIEYKSFYNGAEAITIFAQYFNKNYEFDANATLQINLKNTTLGTTYTYPLLLSNNNYKVNLSQLPAGDYIFTVENADKTIRTSGKFSIIPFNVEQQFLNSNFNALRVLAEKQNGILTFSNTTDTLFNKLLADNRFKTLQKSTKNIVSLIDWKLILGLLIISLSLEWFIRKYNGLI